MPADRSSSCCPHPRAKSACSRFGPRGTSSASFALPDRIRAFHRGGRSLLLRAGSCPCGAAVILARSRWIIEIGPPGFLPRLGGPLGLVGFLMERFRLEVTCAASTQAHGEDRKIRMARCDPLFPFRFATCLFAGNRHSGSHRARVPAHLPHDRIFLPICHTFRKIFRLYIQ
jgi:hypothetical protein